MKNFFPFLAPFLAIIVYSNSLGGEFILDDVFLILKNPSISDLGSLFRYFTLSYWSGTLAENSFVYRPLVNASFILNWLIGGGSPFVFKLTNVAIHAGSCFLIYRIFLRFFQGELTPLFVSLFFACHPLNSEAVNGISYRTDLMVLFFFLLSLELAQNKFYVFSVFSFLLAMFCKENAVALLGVFPLIHFFRFVRLPVKFFLGLGLVIFMYFTLRYQALGSFSKGDTLIPFLDNPIASLAWPERAITSLKVVTMSLERMIYPHRLSADYSFNAIAVATEFLEIEVFLGLLILIANVFFIFLAFKTKSYVALVGFSIFIPVYLLTSNLIFPITNIMAERFLYIPVLGFFVAISPVFQFVIERFHRPAIIVILLILSLFSVKTFARNFDWTDERSLFLSASKVSANSARVWFHLGNAEFKLKKYKKASENYKKALDIYPKYVLAHSNLCVSLASAGEYIEAIESCSEALRYNPKFKKAKETLDYIKKQIGF